MSLFINLNFRHVFRTAFLVSSAGLISSCVTGIPVLDAPQAAIAVVIGVSGNEYDGVKGPSIRSMEICTDETKSECDRHDYPGGSEFSLHVSYEISDPLESGNYDFGLGLLSIDGRQQPVKLLSRRIVTIEHPGTEAASFIDLACTDEGALSGPDATDKAGKVAGEGTRQFKVVGIAVEEQFRSSSFLIRCVYRR